MHSIAIIQPDAVKIIGLQIDTLQKVRSGEIKLDQWERFNNLTTDDREARFGDWKKPEPTTLAKPTDKKFALLVDLGIITVPEGYDHATHLSAFRKEHYEKFYDYNDDINDANFSRPSRILKPGDKLRVRVFEQVVGGATTSEERRAFLAAQKAIRTGAQGASLVVEQKRSQLPEGR